MNGIKTWVEYQAEQTKAQKPLREYARDSYALHQHKHNAERLALAEQLSEGLTLEAL